MRELYRKLSEEEYLDIELRILYEDNHLLIFNKRSGEIVQADKSEDECLSEKLKVFIAERDNKPGAVLMGVTPRIDRPVSGIVIFAKTSKSLERLNKAFREGEIHKTYWALVCEHPERESGELKHSLTRTESKNKSFVSSLPKPGAKEARLIYKLIETTQRYFLLEITLLTGRHHQIRAQLAAMGCHIKGDLKYGAPRSNPDGSISLHARSVKFIHPVKKTEMEIIAPVNWVQINKDKYGKCE